MNQGIMEVGLIAAVIVIVLIAVGVNSTTKGTLTYAANGMVNNAVTQMDGMLP